MKSSLSSISKICTPCSLTLAMACLFTPAVNAQTMLYTPMQQTVSSCLSVNPNVLPQAGDAVYADDCKASVKWKLRADSRLEIYKDSKATGQCLDVDTDHPANYNKVQVWNCASSTSTNQQWGWSKSGDQLKLLSKNLCITPKYISDQLSIESCDSDSKTQKFYTITGAPPPPTITSVVNYWNASALVLSLPDSAMAQSYKIRYQIASSLPADVISNSAQPVAYVTGTRNPASITFKASAKNMFGSSDWSEPMTVDLSNPPCDAMSSTEPHFVPPPGCFPTTAPTMTKFVVSPIQKEGEQAIVEVHFTGISPAESGGVPIVNYSIYDQTQITYAPQTALASSLRSPLRFTLSPGTHSLSIYVENQSEFGLSNGPFSVTVAPFSPAN